MRPFYQTNWHGIQFRDFARMSSARLAGPEFYQAFYERFFSVHEDWNDLGTAWREQKEQCVEVVLSAIPSAATVLSVGCGLGYMEHRIRQRLPVADMFVHEVAPAAWCWLSKEFPDDRRLIGLIPACLPPQIRFDLVYLSAVDYTMTDDLLIGLLASLRGYLRDGGARGRCMIISASTMPETPPHMSPRVLMARAKSVVARVLDHLGVRPIGQLWGWMRTRAEYASLMRTAGYDDIVDGDIESPAGRLYWISGS